MENTNIKTDNSSAYVHSKGHKIGMVAFHFLLLVLVVFDIFFDPSTQSSASGFLALSFTLWVADCFVQYRFQKKKRFLIYAIICTALCLFNIAAHIIIRLG